MREDYKEWGSVIVGSPLLTRERAEDFVEHWAKPRAEKEFPPGHVWLEQPVVYLIATAKEGRALGYEDAIPSLGPFPRMDPEGNGPGWYAWRGASCKEET